MTTEVRLSKYLAQKGLCSRREADRYIEQGLVTVDGRVERHAWFRVQPEHKVELAHKARATQDQQLTVLLNKPLGYVSSQPEKGYQGAVTLLTPENYAGDGKAPRITRRHTLAPAGRLDINSTGLLVLTQDGRIARSLIGNNSRVEKEYLVRHHGSVSDEQLGKLRHGLHLDERELRPAKVKRLNDSQFRIVLVEGRKRQIRRMCELTGIEIAALKRVRVGKIKLGDLPRGNWRTLKPGESFV